MSRDERIDRFGDDDLEPRCCAECGERERPEVDLVWAGDRLVCEQCGGVAELPCRTCGAPTSAKPPICDGCVQPVEVVPEIVRRRTREMAA